jgi:addiction module HigA family antidote
MANPPQPPHPGIFLVKGFLLPRDITVSELAHSMNIDVTEVHRFIDEEIPCTTDLAHRLAAALGIDADFWISAQDRYDAWLKSEGLYEAYHLAAN